MVLLLATRVMSGGDIKVLDWPVLWLVAGGIALGNGVGATGLDAWLLGSFNWEAMPTLMVIAVLTFIGFGMANVISHSATANLLIPLGLSFSAVIGIDIVMLAVILAISTSLGMSMPISTPPNAIAYSTGVVPLKAMAISGMVIGTIGALILVFVMPWFWELTGMMGG